MPWPKSTCSKRRMPCGSYQPFISPSQPSTPHQGYYHNRPKSAVGNSVLGPTKLEVPATNGSNGKVGVKGRAAFDDFQAGVTSGTWGWTRTSCFKVSDRRRQILATTGRDNGNSELLSNIYLTWSPFVPAHLGMAIVCNPYSSPKEERLWHGIPWLLDGPQRHVHMFVVFSAMRKVLLHSLVG